MVFVQKKKKKMQAGPLLSSLSPSFNSYPSSGTGNLAEIAARVVNEFRHENKKGFNDDDVFGFEDDEPWEFAKDDHQSRSLITSDDGHDHEKAEEEKEEEGEESDFEFAFAVSTEQESLPISADEIFYNGQIKPVYPLFDQSLLLDDTPKNDVVEVKKENNDKTTSRTRQPLRKLMVEEERETATTTSSSSSFSSSEADELEGLQQGTYCVWKPKNDAVKGRKKSGSTSTNSSKRWKFRDILSRSNSVSKERFLFVKLGSSKRTGKVEDTTETEKNDVVLVTNDEVNGEKGKTNDEDKKKSGFPYKHNLVGFLANVNGLSRNLHPF